ncbi:hypothetical protein [Agrococcus beijingensis]|uniref:hypothetical protein n=1 Tax=Agrococcus beijingensis TaxID=3068634 RepID=UPI0027427773|nr:hypothetical protein [Agrococcus sp. REN33]
MLRRMPIAWLATVLAILLALAAVVVPMLRAAALDAAEGGVRWADAVGDAVRSPGIAIVAGLCAAIALLTVVVSHQQLRRDALESGGAEILAAWAPVERVAALAVIGIMGDVVAAVVGIGMQPLWLTWPVPGESPLVVVPTVLVLLVGPVLGVVALVLQRRTNRALGTAAVDRELERRTRHSVVGRRHHEPSA